MTPTHVLITGAAHGIGFETALGYAQHGARLSLVDRDGDALRAAARSIQDRSGVIADTDAADLRDPDAVEHAVDEAWSRSTVDVLVNCAGIYPAIPFLDLDAVMWDKVYDINVRAPMLCMAAVARRAKRAGHPVSIVNISSTASLRSRPGAAAYSSSKAAVEMLTRAAALELGPYDIRVNAIAPGFIPVHSTINPVSDDYAALVSRNPLGVPGTAADIARAVMWIAGPDARWITGSVLRVDGGSSTGSHTLPLSWDTVVTGD